MRTFTINGKEYKAKPFDFDLMCELEEKGIIIEAMGLKPRSAVRAYFKICAGRMVDAGKELNEHIISSGTLDEIIEVMNKEMDESDFFQALKKNAEQKIAESQSEQEEESTEI